jgi:hypothetical protein
MKSLYDLIWGQCSKSLRSRLRGNNNYSTYTANVDSTALLKGIRAGMSGFSNKQYLPHALHKTMCDFYNLSQGKQRNNQEYYDEFNSMVLNAEESGATIGAHPSGVNKILSNTAADRNLPTAGERTAAIKSATVQYLAGSRFSSEPTESDMVPSSKRLRMSTSGTREAHPQLEHTPLPSRRRTTTFVITKRTPRSY